MKRLLLKVSCVAFALLLSWPAVALVARPEPEIATGTAATVQSATGKTFMAVTANPMATQAAYKVLEQDGSAADAAIAAQLVLGLVEPQSSGLGGGAFVLYYDADNGRTTSYDGRETAPRDAEKDLFLGADGQPMAFYEAVIGGRSVGVPGTPKLLETIYREHGKATWRSLFDYAIAIADNGFNPSPRLTKMIADDIGKLDRYEIARTYFHKESGAPVTGSDVLKNESYAKTLRKFRDTGSAYFYDINAPENMAGLIVDTVRMADDNPGLMTVDDLENYDVREREPVCGPYRGYKICSMAEPSSGGLTILQALGMLERFNLAALEPEDAKSWHLIAEASRLAFADRNEYMADPDFVATPGRALIAPDYIASRSALISEDQRQETVMAGMPDREGGTSHISIIDKYGNALSMTTTIEGAFGSRLMAGGFLLNNELTDFSFEPEKDGKPVANRVEGGKRPRSSMAPTIVFDADDKPVLIVGSAGGSRIIGFVLQRIIAFIDWDMDVADALAMKHVLARSDTVEIEDKRMAQGLREFGHEIKADEMTSGLTAITVKDGIMKGAADPRREGTAMGR